MAADKAGVWRRGGEIAWRILGNLERRGPVKWLAFVACLAAFGTGAFITAFDDATRYASVEEADWIPTNMWLKAAECARLRGAWLAICDGDRLVPMSEYSFGDDPGHGLLLGVWAMATHDSVSLVDVARLNIGLNAAGLIVLASFLFAIRAYVTSIVLLIFGPVVYLGWIGISPHWSFIGVTSMALILPMALIAREAGFLSRRSGNAHVIVGLLGLGVAALVREPIGVMGLVTSIGVIGVLAVRRLRSGGRLWGLLAVGALVWIASASTTWVVSARDALFEMAPAQRVATHNFSHTLYIGLGAVPNKFGITYDDEVARAAVEAVSPTVVNSSPEYYRILWRLYWSKLSSEPLEVMRIYFEKAKLVLADPILDSAPPLAFVLVLAMAHLVGAAAFGMWRRLGFSQGFLIEGAALMLIGLFVAQAIVAHQTRMFAMPIGAALLLLLGVMLEFCCRAGLTFLSQGRMRGPLQPGKRAA